MNIEDKLKELAEKVLPEMSYTLGSMTEIDAQLDLQEPPFMWVVFPSTGALLYANGRVKERLRTLIGFFDLVRRDANGEDNMAVYRRMCGAARQYLDAINTCGYFAEVAEVALNIYTEIGAANVTGCIMDVELSELTGHCV